MYLQLVKKGIVVAAVAVTAFFYIGFGRHSKVLYGDALGYYMYLPSAFIYHNIVSLDFPADKGIDEGTLWYIRQMKERKAANGGVVNQYTYGVALMEAPFFLPAHEWEQLHGTNANGFTPVYNAAIKLSSFVYAVLGLLVLYKILRRYFDDTYSLLGTAFIFTGTHLFWFSLYQGGMSHVPLFFLYAQLVYLTIRVHERPRIILFVIAGLTAGMITVIRPADIVCILIPVLYDVYNRQTLRNKLAFLRQNASGIAVAVVAFIIPAIPQLLYWKVTTGQYVFYSYAGQGFNWAHPKIIEGLFYFNNGWFPYTPLMIFALTGLLFWKPYKQWIWAIVAVLILYVYIIYSWYCYNYINGLGSRPMSHLYPLLALPFTSFLAQIPRLKPIARAPVVLACLFFTAINIAYSMQQAKGILGSDESNIKYNMQMMFRMNLHYNDAVVKDIWEFQPDTSRLRKVASLISERFNDPVSTSYVGDTTAHSGFVYHLRSDESEKIFFTIYNRDTFSGARWIKCSGKFMYPHLPDYFKHLLVIQAGHNAWRGCKIENKIRDWDRADNGPLDHNEAHRWGTVSFFVRVPKNLADGDTIKLMVWNTGRQELYMDDISMELFSNK